MGGAYVLLYGWGARLLLPLGGASLSSPPRPAGGGGGGSAPAAVLDGFGVAVECAGLSAKELEKKLREGELPVISRINHDQVLLDVRTLTADEYELIAARLREIDEEKLA